jgi:hypothetical protein
MVIVTHNDTMTSVPTLTVVALEIGQDCLSIVLCDLEIVGELPASGTITAVDEIL